MSPPPAGTKKARLVSRPRLLGARVAYQAMHSHTSAGNNLPYGKLITYC